MHLGHNNTLLFVLFNCYVDFAVVVKHFFLFPFWLWLLYFTLPIFFLILIFLSPFVVFVVSQLSWLCVTLILIIYTVFCTFTLFVCFLYYSLLITWHVFSEKKSHMVFKMSEKMAKSQVEWEGHMKRHHPCHLSKFAYLLTFQKVHLLASSSFLIFISHLASLSCKCTSFFYDFALSIIKRKNAVHSFERPLKAES